MTTDVVVTKEEQRAIKSLQRLAKKWPGTLELFSWSGALVILKKGSDGRDCNIADITGIYNDGGDPDNATVNQFPNIKYET